MLQTSLVRFFKVRLTHGKLRSPKKTGGIHGRNPYEDAERSCGVTLFAGDVFEKSLLEKGTADGCEHTVARRMGEVKFCAGDLRSATQCRKTGDPAQSSEDGRKSKVLAKQAGEPD